MRRSVSRRIVLMVTAVVAGLCGGRVISAQAPNTGFLNRAVTLDGVVHRYQVYVPLDYQPSSRLPVILALHGGGEYGVDGLLQTASGLAAAIRRHAERVPAIVVFPQSAPGTTGFQGLGERMALAELDQAIAEFKADPGRIYLTGFSMGGNGAWNLAFRHAERFAALLVICGFVEEYTGTTSGTHYPALAAPSDGDPFAAVARRVARLPIWLFHGDADRTVSVEQSRRMFAALKAVGADVQYTELPGVPHNAWDPAYDRPDVFTWLFQQRR